MTARLEDFGNVALDDLAGEPFRDRRLPDARVADVERVVLRAAAEDLHRAVDLGHAPDQRIDLAGLGFLVEVDGELLERRFLLGRSFSVFSSAPSGARVSVGVSPLPTPWLM